VTRRSAVTPLLVAAVLAGNVLAWLVGWEVPW
jgi:hypothetical protein